MTDEIKNPATQDQTDPVEASQKQLHSATETVEQVLRESFQAADKDIDEVADAAGQEHAKFNEELVTFLHDQAKKYHVSPVTAALVVLGTCQQMVADYHWQNEFRSKFKTEQVRKALHRLRELGGLMGVAGDLIPPEMIPDGQENAAH